MTRYLLLATAKLSPAQVAVLAAMANGHDRRTAAAKLHYSQSTVAGYLETIRQKLGARNTTHAVAIAVAAGMVKVDGLHRDAFGGEVS